VCNQHGKIRPTDFTENYNTVAVFTVALFSVNRFKHHLKTYYFTIPRDFNPPSDCPRLRFKFILNAGVLTNLLNYITLHYKAFLYLCQKDFTKTPHGRSGIYSVVGEGRSADYVEVLRGVHFVHRRPEDVNSRTFRLTCVELKDRYASNQLTVQVHKAAL